MLSLDLFDSKYERKLHEGAVDDAEYARLKTLGEKIDYLKQARAKTTDPEMRQAIDGRIKEYNDERMEILSVRGMKEAEQPQRAPTKGLLKGKDLVTPQQRVAGATPPKPGVAGAVKDVAGGIKRWLRGEPDQGPTYEAYTDPAGQVNPKTTGNANMGLLIKANSFPQVRPVTFEFPTVGAVPLDAQQTEVLSDYYDGLGSSGAQTHFIYNVLSSYEEVNRLMTKLGAPLKAQAELLPAEPGSQGQLPLSEKKKSQDKPELKAGDVKVARELQKLRAQYPAARSDVEAVARAEIDSSERSRQQIAAIRGANEKQDSLLKQLVALDREQGKEIDNLDQENDTLDQQLAQVQATNDRLQQTIAQMTGTKTADGSNVINLIPGAPADTPAPQQKPKTKQQVQPKVEPKTEPKNIEPMPKEKGPEVFQQMTRTITAPQNVGNLKSLRTQEPDNDAQFQLTGTEESVKEHGGGIGPRQHWQDLMQEGQPQELINRYLAIDAENDVDAVRAAIQAISRDPTLGANSKSRLLGQIGMIITRHRLPIGRSYYQFMRQYMEAVELDRARVAGYPNDPATAKHRLDTAKAILGDPASDADSRREAAGIVAKLDKKVVAEGLLYSGDTWQDVLYRINVLNDIFGDQKDLAASFEPASQPEWIPFRDRILRSSTVLDTYAKVKQLANMNVPLTDVEIEMLADVAWDGGGGPVEPAGHWGERDYDWLEDLYAQQFAVVQHLLDQRAQGHGQNKTKSGQTVHEQGMAETVTNVKAGMAEIYRRLAPKIERHRDSFLAGQLYDELENYAELHGAEGEFKRMMATARNSAHMEYDTNPGGFQNWFWFLPFEDEQVEESTDDIKKKMSKLEALALAANRAGDDSKCKRYQQKIQSLKQKLSQSMAEGWSDQGNPTPYSVYIDGREWRAYKSDDHARAVAEKVRANLERQGREQTVTIAPSRAKKVQEDFGMPGTTIPRKSLIQGFTVFWNPKTQVVSVTRGGDSEEAAIEQARVGTPSMKNFRQAADRLIDRIESDEDKIISEGIRDTASATAVIACLLTGGSLTGCATAPQQTSAQQVLKTGQDIGRTVQTAKKITRAGTEAEVQQELRNILRGINRPEELNNSNIIRIWKRIKGQPPVQPEPQAPEYGPADPVRRPATFEAKEIVSKEDFVRERDRLLRMIGIETDPANKQILKSAIRQLENRAENEGWITIQSRMVREDSDGGEAVEMAIMRRMLVAHTDLIVEFGLDKVVDAIEEVAYDVGDVDEIGSSDVSGWIRQVERILGVGA